MLSKFSLVFGGARVGFKASARPTVGLMPPSTRALLIRRPNSCRVDTARDQAPLYGINVGAGFNFRSSGVGFFVEGRFHDIMVSGSDFHYIPITAGVRFGG